MSLQKTQNVFAENATDPTRILAVDITRDESAILYGIENVHGVSEVPGQLLTRYNFDKGGPIFIVLHC